MLQRERWMQYQQQWVDEWKSVLHYWQTKVTDPVQGGFYGSVNQQNEPDPTAARGLVQYSRILWAFSLAWDHFREPGYRETAQRAYDYITRYFTDTEYGGMYWSVEATGRRLEDRKQIYGQAFCIYGLCEFYRSTGHEPALHTARSLFQLIEVHSYDATKGGYLEAFTRNWELAGDLRLSAKDDNAVKTMNTHLHVIEAYVQLYRHWPDPLLHSRIQHLLDAFHLYFIDPVSKHLRLFFTRDWQSVSSLVSYGHDIEAAWLLLQCAEIIGDEVRIRIFRKYALGIAQASLEGIDASDGGLWYEYAPDVHQRISEKHSWVQAEAMIGFMNAYELTGDVQWLAHVMRSWEFIRLYIRDAEQGEWFWGVDEDRKPMPNQDKAGFWKCPYHNTRAFHELIQRVSRIQERFPIHAITSI